MASTANEKANLKGKFTAYIIGVILIFMCSTIAGAVANVTTSMGNGGASGVIDAAISVGGMTVADGNTNIGGEEEVQSFLPSKEDIENGLWIEDTDKLNNYYAYPADGDVTYKNPANLFSGDPYLEAKDTSTKKFKCWYVIKKDTYDDTYEVYEDENPKITLTLSDDIIDSFAIYDYKVYAIYEDK